MSRSFRRGLLTAAAVWAASAAAGSEWSRNHDNDNQWLASTVIVTSTVLVDLRDVNQKCLRGDIVCGPTPPPTADPKHCPECEKWHKDPKDPKDPVDVYHGLWGGCSGDYHCPNGCSCSTKAICEHSSDGPKCKSSTDCSSGHMCNSYGYCQPLPGPRCHEKACVIDHGPECTTNKDCSHGEVCNHHGVCQKVVFPDCEKNSDCKHGQICTHRGICKTVDDPQCTCDSDCKDGQICNSQRICQDLECPKCQWEKECHHGESCKDSFCKPKENKCKDKDDCKDGEICDWEGKCRRGKHFGCRVDSECKFGQICDIHGRCQKRPVGTICGSDRECKSDDFCNAFGYCEKKPEEKCETDNECLPGEICSSAKCLPKIGCSKDEECRHGEVCEHKFCVFKKVCEFDSDCGNDRRCSKDHKCEEKEKPECTSDAQCGEERKCNKEHKCEKKEEPECTSDAQCGNGKKCNKEHKCEKKEKACEYDIDCGKGEICVPKIEILKTLATRATEPVQDGVCIKPECKVDGDCKELGEFCNKDHKCVKEECKNNGDCKKAEEFCNNHICVKKKCQINADCEGKPGLFCKNDECVEEECKDNGDCKGKPGPFCNNHKCVKEQCTANRDCDERSGEVCINTKCTDKCIAGRCQQGSVCSLGFQWAHYKLARSPSDTKTSKGVIPIHNSDPQTRQNWPILHFQPEICLDGQIPLFKGLTQTLGIQKSCPPEHAKVYGTDTQSSIDFTIIQHIGFFVPKQQGTYTFKTNAPVPDQTLYAWFGENARQGWINTNADLIGDGNWAAGSNTFLKVVAQADVGKYIPIRILFVNSQDCGEFGLTVQGPQGEILVSRDQKSTDGQFVSNCPVANDILSLNLEPIISVNVGIGSGGINLPAGSSISALAGSLAE
ncbi:GLEYA domain-containing protein [Trichoderma velutinum]